MRGAGRKWNGLLAPAGPERFGRPGVRVEGGVAVAREEAQARPPERPLDLPVVIGPLRDAVPHLVPAAAGATTDRDARLDDARSLPGPVRAHDDRVAQVDDL